MSQATVLVIDDSATIRKMVDSHLSQEGYRVVLAANAEEGLALAAEVRPDLILLDHQLPGITGSAVYRQLVQLPGCQHTPVVVTSTLRKRAYAEYTDFPNVVDSLPKPFTPELLKTTVANALETGSLVVESQTRGTAVPEVMHPLEDTALTGSFRWFGLREVLDFLTNGGKRGALVVETERDRIWVYLDGGRIQATVGASVNPDEVARTLPATLHDLAPVLKFTVGGGACPQMDGLGELLDNKVLDTRMLRGLLRHQAAMLLHRCFTVARKSFSFEADRTPPALFRKVPLDISLSALLVEGALVCPQGELPPETQGALYLRRGLRGQNLDRTGLSAHHMKALTYLEEPLSLDALTGQLELPRDEVRRVLYGLQLAEWVQTHAPSKARYVVALETDPAGAHRLRALLAPDAARYTGKVVRDRLGVQLLLKRSCPDVLLIALDTDEQRNLLRQLRAASEWKQTKFVGIRGNQTPAATTDGVDALSLDAVLDRPYLEEQVLEALDRLFGGAQAVSPSADGQSAHAAFGEEHGGDGEGDGDAKAHAPLAGAQA